MALSANRAESRNSGSGDGNHREFHFAAVTI
jgi:hypothetical protein